MVLGGLEGSHFATIEKFMGHDWLEKGATNLQQRIERAATEGIIDSRPENSAHPLHLLWYKFIWGQFLPSDLMFARDSQIDRALHQMHRFLTLEYLLGRLLADWTGPIKNDVRAKLRNAPQLAATLYELEVVDHFRREGHDIQLVAGGTERSADIRGDILGVSASIECKRLSIDSDENRI